MCGSFRGREKRTAGSEGCRAQLVATTVPSRSVPIALEGLSLGVGHPPRPPIYISTHPLSVYQSPHCVHCHALIYPPIRHPPAPTFLTRVHLSPCICLSRISSAPRSEYGPIVWEMPHGWVSSEHEVSLWHGGPALG